VLEDLRFAFRQGVARMVEFSWCPNPAPTPQVNERACLRGPHAQDHRGVDLISDALPFGRLWYGEPNAASNAIGYAQNQTNNTGSKMKKSGLE
jgi:hypothetical protein